MADLGTNNIQCIIPYYIPIALILWMYVQVVRHGKSKSQTLDLKVCIVHPDPISAHWVHVVQQSERNAIRASIIIVIFFCDSHARLTICVRIHTVDTPEIIYTIHVPPRIVRYLYLHGKSDGALRCAALGTPSNESRLTQKKKTTRLAMQLQSILLLVPPREN
ncbi:hypothetical protein F4804DRAFT_314533 [Jackrogersella minutella]|nr:hypothetical protein F4804DRAFT_314533 [Jackrogersella minutella]